MICFLLSMHCLQHKLPITSYWEDWAIPILNVPQLEGDSKSQDQSVPVNVPEFKDHSKHMTSTPIISLWAEPISHPPSTFTVSSHDSSPPSPPQPQASLPQSHPHPHHPNPPATWTQIPAQASCAFLSLPWRWAGHRTWRESRGSLLLGSIAAGSAVMLLALAEKAWLDGVRGLLT